METYQLVGMNASNQTIELPETKRKLVDAGIQVMRTKGFNATSVDDICASAGVSKGAFFHYFKGKDDLARTAVARFSEAKAKAYDEAPFQKLEDPLARVYGRLDFAWEASGGLDRLTKGCLIGTFAQELAFTHPEMRTACNEAFARIAANFEKDLTLAKARYAPQADFEPKNVARLYVSILQGSLMMAKAADSNEILRENIEQFRHYLQALFGPTAVTPSTRLN